MGLASRARQIWSKNRKRPHFASLSQANPSPESKNFFLNKTKKSSRICRGFEQLSRYCGWRVITKKPTATIVALVGGKVCEGEKQSQFLPTTSPLWFWRRIRHGVHFRDKFLSFLHCGTSGTSCFKNDFSSQCRKELFHISTKIPAFFFPVYCLAKVAH